MCSAKICGRETSRSMSTQKTRKQEDNLKMNIRGIGYEDWWHMELAQNNVQ